MINETGGRVVVSHNTAPPSGRVVFVDVNAAHGATTPAPVQATEDGNLVCFKCRRVITTKVCEWEQKV